MSQIHGPFAPFPPPFLGGGTYIRICEWSRRGLRLVIPETVYRLSVHT